MSKQLDPLVVASYFCKLSEYTDTNLKIQKLLYITEMAYVGINEGEAPLFSKDFEAWQYGPVIPDIYYDLREFGKKPIPKSFFDENKKLENEPIRRFLIHIYDTFGIRSAGRLVDYVHVENGAWEKAYLKCIGTLIEYQDIVEEHHFRKSF